MNELKEKLKLQIIEHLNLEDVDVADIQDDEPLFNEGLGLDSIDALEIVVMLEKEYGIIVKSSKDIKTHLESINTLAKFVAENKN